MQAILVVPFECKTPQPRTIIFENKKPLQTARQTRLKTAELKNNQALFAGIGGRA